MRNALSDALVRLATTDRNVLLLTGDHGYALFDPFRRECADRFINAGIAEQNMVGMAAGLARQGFRPIVYGLAAFIPVRVLEQIKLDIAHDDLPVILLGDGAGFVYSHLGTSHQSTEDIACTRVIPGLSVFSPADRFEMAACMDLAHTLARPVYVRIGKSDRGDVHAAPLTPDHLRRPLRVHTGRDQGPALLATGSMVRTALDLARRHWPEASVYSLPVLKPVNDAAMVELLQRHPKLVTLEEHTVAGGLGSLVAEISTSTILRPLLRIGVNDRFSEHCGSYDYLLKEHGLDESGILPRVEAFLADA